MSQDWSASLYEGAHSFVWKRAGDLIPLLDPKPGERILDLGCGTGQLTEKLAALGAQVVGLDSSPEMVAQARQNYPKLTFVLADARTLSFEAPFDAVFSNAALHWIREADAVVSSVAGALRPGGRFVAEFGGKRNIAALLAAVNRVLERRGYTVDFHWYFPSIGEFAAVLERHGFEVAQAAHFDRFTPLDDSEHGVEHWLEMFGAPLLKQAPAREHAAIRREVQAEARTALWREGGWHMDYVRLRVAAVLKRGNI